MKIKFLSLNIWEGGRLFQPMLAFLRREAADITALQEVISGHDPALRRRFRGFDVLQWELRMPYAAFAPAFFDEDSGAKSGNAVLSRFPLNKYPTIFFDVPYGHANIKTARRVMREHPEVIERIPRNMQHVAARLPGGRLLHVVNLQGIWGTDGNDNPRRLAMGRRILELIRPLKKVPALLSGDFNVDRRTRTIRGIEKCFVNTLALEPRGTFNNRRKKPWIPDDATIDFVFASPATKVVEARMPHEDVSDHLPQIAVVEIP